jgi:anti-sigma regulatory factor (Ser/Thr protein kinase)
LALLAVGAGEEVTISVRGNALQCEYSRLTVPARPDYAAVAGRYAGEVARLIGFGDDDAHLVELGVQQALSEIITYSFEPYELATVDVSCERIPEGLKITLRDEGLPLDPAQTRRGQCAVPEDDTAAEIVCIEDYMDEVRFRNLGREGKETVLIKHLRNRGITDYYDACELEPYGEPQPRGRVPSGAKDCQVRPMKPSDAVEVSKCVYRAYGYSYGHEALYYPDRLVELNESGRILSVVAVVDGEIAGHCGLMFWDASGRIAEMGMGVVKPEFRSRGCFVNMTEYLMDEAKRRGLEGVYGQAVTNHIQSQRTALSFGMRDCALKLGYIPSTVSFKSMSEQLTQRGSLIVHFAYLEPAASAELYVPMHHREMIGALYRELGASPTFVEPSGRVPELEEDESVLRTTTVSTLNAAFIEVERYGRNVAQEMRARVREFCLKQIAVIYLYIDLVDPATFHLTEAFEQQGFFFSGILPAGALKGDALVLQYLNNVPIEYEQVKVVSEIGRTLLTYIRNHDPNTGSDAPSAL